MGQWGERTRRGRMTVGGRIGLSRRGRSGWREGRVQMLVVTLR